MRYGVDAEGVAVGVAVATGAGAGVDAAQATTASKHHSQESEQTNFRYALHLPGSSALRKATNAVAESSRMGNIRNSGIP